MGISYPTVVNSYGPRLVEKPAPEDIPEPGQVNRFAAGAGSIAPMHWNRNNRRKLEEHETKPAEMVRRHDFIVQFCWKPRRLSERIMAREQQQLDKRLDDAAAVAANR